MQCIQYNVFMSYDFQDIFLLFIKRRQKNFKLKFLWRAKSDSVKLIQTRASGIWQDLGSMNLVRESRKSRKSRRHFKGFTTIRAANVPFV